MNHGPERGTFQINRYLARCRTDGKASNPDRIELYTNMQQHQQIPDESGKQNNMDHALCGTTWICDKVRTNTTYAQNLYAAMCNREFQRQAVWTILRNDRWSCSWHRASGIIADIRQEGDYLNWYCSGWLTGFNETGLCNVDTTGTLCYVPEGQVTNEIRTDLALLGWHVLDDLG